jgi:hypothetical protein
LSRPAYAAEVLIKIIHSYWRGAPEQIAFFQTIECCFAW